MIWRSSLAIILLSALPVGANRPFWWVLLAIALFALFAAQSVKDMRTKLDDVAMKVIPVGMAYLAVLGWALVQALLPVSDVLAHPVWQLVPNVTGRISADPIASLHHVMRLAAYGMAFWIAVRCARDPKVADRMLSWIAIWISGLSLFGIFAVLAEANLFLGDRATTSVSASFINRNNFATYAVIGFVANIAVYTQSKNAPAVDRKRELRDFLEHFFSGGWVYTCGIVITLGAILFSQSRAGMMAAAIAALVFFLTERRKGDNSNALIVPLFTLSLVGFAFVALSSGTFDRILSSQAEEGRFVLYPLVIAALAARPILGHGLGGFHDAFRPYVPQQRSLREIDLAHSSYLENAFELGIPTALLFFGVLLIIVGIIFRGVRKRRRNVRFVRFAFTVAVAAGFHAVFDFSLQIPAIGALFAFVLGIGWAQAFSSSERRSE